MSYLVGFQRDVKEVIKTGGYILIDIGVLTHQNMKLMKVKLKKDKAPHFLHKPPK
ncbi:hypothetical protein [Thermovenabulum sp.]|uniref:hypothetical protein n=1 Tax=Thermovenabulum sp. TaxID=3100335 RepID=UPI003C79747D